MDFGIPPKFNQTDILAEFELLQQQLTAVPAKSDVAAATCRASLAAEAFRFAQSPPDTRSFSLTREHIKLLKELRKNPEIVISRPDKGRATVIMSAVEYRAKMMVILNDTTKFCRLGPCDGYDHTANIDTKLSKYLLFLSKSHQITQYEHDRLAPTGSTRPRMYGLPKIHKKNIPLRPILSMSSSPQYKISKWLCAMLQTVLTLYNRHCVKDTFEFVDKIRKSKFESCGYMCSYDVVSLFTNVPLRETIDICAAALYHNKSVTPPDLNESEFVKLMLMVTSGVEFSFDNVMYKQLDGVAMGSPLGPVLANIFVGFCESSIPPSLWPSVYYRFVDDVFCHDEDQETCENFLTTLNGLHPALKFTAEGERDGVISFLDVNITRNNDTKGLDMTVYRKPTFTGLYIPWGSYTPTKSKVHLVKALVYRAHRICSPHLLQEELRRLTSILTNNGYPSSLLTKLINNKPITQDPKPFGPDRCPVVLRLPWVGAGSARVEKEVRNIVCSSYPCVKLYLVFGTTRAFSVKKDVLPTLSRSNLIYFFQCRECEDRYVGRTLQHLGARIRQHVPLGLVPVDARGTRPRRGRPPKCAVQSDTGTPLSASSVDVRMRASASTGGELDPSQTSVRKRGRPSRKPPNVTPELTDTGRVTRSKVKRRGTGDLNTSVLEVTTTINKRKRGRPRSQTKTTMNSKDVGGVNKPNGREQRQTSKVTELNDRTSSIKRHLSGSANCRELYSDDVFSVLTRGRSKLHLAVLEALYIRKLDPELCVQKENVLSLQLFGVTPRESVTSAS